MADTPRRLTGETWLFGLFSALFAVSLILHQLRWGGFDLGFPHFPVVVAALWALLRPTSVGRFTAMIATKVVAVALDMPFVGSHTLLVLISGASVLAYLTWTALRAGQLPDAGAVFDDIAPFLRVQVLVVYAAAAVAKLNTGFFDPAVSCAAAMARHVAWFPFLLDDTWQIEPAIWGTVIIEAALPILLAIRRTRLPGLVVGVGFHTVLALSGHVPFSALALALYVAFLPVGTPERVRALVAGHPRVARWAGGPAMELRNEAFAVLVLVGGWLAGAALATADPVLVATLIGEGSRLAVVGIALGAGLLLVVCRYGARHPPRSLRPGHPVLLAGVLLLVMNGLCPYLGLKTDSSFEMFSNLRTEPGAWNHLVVPESVRVFGYQDELVRVVDSNDPALLARSADGTRLVRFELDRYLRTHPGTIATYATTNRGNVTTWTIGPLPPGTTGAHRIATFLDAPPPGRGRC